MSNWAAAILIALGAMFSLTRYATPALALGAGIAIALAIGNPWRRVTSRISGRLLQAAVVGLGFGIPINALMRAGISGVGVTALTIAAVFGAGFALTRWLAVERTLGVLITLAGVQSQNVNIMLFGTVVGGIGFGAAFMAGKKLRLIVGSASVKMLSTLQPSSLVKVSIGRGWLYSVNSSPRLPKSWPLTERAASEARATASRAG